MNSLSARLLPALALAAAVSGAAGPAFAADRVSIDAQLPDYSPAEVSPAPGAGYLTADGRVAFVGYNDMRDMAETWDRLFERSHPGIRFAPDLPATRAAPAALADGRSAFAPMGAAFTENQLRIYRAQTGSDPVQVRVSHGSLSPKARSGPLCVIVNPAIPLQRITVSAMEGIFTGFPAGGMLARWGQLGLRGPWAGAAVHPIGLGSETALGEEMLGVHMHGRRYASVVRQFHESAEVFRAVASDRRSIGFVRANLIDATVKVLAVGANEAGPFYPPTAGNVVGGRYPYDHFLFIALRRDRAGRLDPLAVEYLRLVLSKEGQEAVAGTPQGYLPLNAREAAEERAKLGMRPPETR